MRLQLAKLKSQYYFMFHNSFQGQLPTTFCCAILSTLTVTACNIVSKLRLNSKLSFIRVFIQYLMNSVHCRFGAITRKSHHLGQVLMELECAALTAWPKGSLYLCVAHLVSQISSSSLGNYAFPAYSRWLMQDNILVSAHSRVILIVGEQLHRTGHRSSVSIFYSAWGFID